MDKIKISKVVSFVLLLSPALYLSFGLITLNLGTNPVETLTHETGKWGLICLILSLCCTPVKNIFRWSPIMRFRRMLGLFSFFYICLHFLVYWVFDQSLSFAYVWDDIRERPYITLGFSAWLIFLALAITSTQNWRRKLARNWIRLHKLVYLATLLAIGHYIWLIRADYSEVYIYALAIAVLLGYRLARAANKKWK